MNNRCTFIMTVLCGAQLATATIKADQTFQLQTSEKRTFLFKIKKSSIFAPQRLGNIELYHDMNGFHVVQNGKSHEVGNQWVDPLLRNKKSGFLQAFLAKGYIAINQMSDGEFCLRANARLLGGGPFAAAWAYSITKTLLYGVGLGVAGTVVVATGGVAGGIGAVAVGAAGSGVTAGVAAGTTYLAAGAISATTATSLTVATTTAVASSGGVAAASAGVVAAVEGISLAVAGLFGTMPTP